MLNKITVLGDQETWDMAENCYSMWLTDEQLEELGDGGSIFDLGEVEWTEITNEDEETKEFQTLLEKITDRMKAEDLDD